MNDVDATNAEVLFRFRSAPLDSLAPPFCLSPLSLLHLQHKCSFFSFCLAMSLLLRLLSLHCNPRG